MPSFDFDEAIPITAKDIKSAWNFARESAKQTDPRNFRSDEIRSFDQIIDAVGKGKLGEIAFKRYAFVRYGVRLKISLEINGIFEGDGGKDIHEICIDGDWLPVSMKVDVKETPRYSKWLLADSFRLDKDVYIDTEFDREQMIVNVRGFSWRHDFYIGGEPRYPFPKDSRLFDPDLGSEHKIGPPLQAEMNYGIPRKNARRDPGDWESLFQDLANNAMADQYGT